MLAGEKRVKRIRIHWVAALFMLAGAPGDGYCDANGGAPSVLRSDEGGVVVAVASSHLDHVVPPSTVVFGEVGLAGEVRGVSFGEQRVKESARLGFERCILPRSSARGIKPTKGMELIGARDLQEVWGHLFPG